MLVETSVPHEGWRETADIENKLTQAAKCTLHAIDPGAWDDAELSIVLGSNELVANLNRSFKGMDGPTNVLSFSAGMGPGTRPRLLGDVVLAYEIIHAEAREQRKTITNHACHLTVHGVLHLLGYTHSSKAEAERMERLERDILSDLGVPDPYVAADDCGHGQAL